MQRSDTIGKLAVALVAAQAELKTVTKDAVNPHFKNKYASLDTIIEHVRPVLAKHSLAIVQGATTPDRDEQGRVTAFTLETMLVHATGEWISGATVMPLAKVDPQGVGSAMTYGRRYGISALLCLATDEDDDGDRARATNGNGSAQRDERRYPETPSGTAKPAHEKRMPFGKQKGKLLGEMTFDELTSAAKWCREKDEKKFAELIAALDAVAAEKAQEEFPAALHDEADDLPF